MEEDQTKEKKKTSEKDSAKLTELEKYWQVVRDNPSDFAGWTYLLHYVEQENAIEASREAFKAFFSHYPYCYGYWKKFADMEKTLMSPEAAEQVFEDGVKAIPLSVDLWIHYLNFYKTQYKDSENYYANVKKLFGRALSSAGREFRSDRLWDMYVTWEEENNNLKAVTAAYDSLITTPTQLYSHHFEKLRKHIKSNSPRDILSTDEFLDLRQQVLAETKASGDAIVHDEDDEGKLEGDKGEALPPGVDSLDDVPPGIVDVMRKDKDLMTDEELELLRKKILERRKPMHERNEVEVGKRWSFEEGIIEVCLNSVLLCKTRGKPELEPYAVMLEQCKSVSHRHIKRPYFHVKALERAQLKNWKDYLDFEIENGIHDRVVILFERCLIACALYEDLWMKYAKYMEEKDLEGAGNVYERACAIHLPKKPNIHFCWAAYEERRNNLDKACEILEKLRENVPDVLEIVTRQINLERRRQNHDRVEELYSKYISEAKNKSMASFFSIKFGRFLYKVKNDVSRAVEVIKEALLQDPTNPKLYMQLVDVGYQSKPIDEALVIEAFDSALSSDMTEDQKIVFSQRRLEFLEDFGNSATSIQDAYQNHIKLLKNYNLSSRKRPHDDSEDPEKDKKPKTEVNGVVAVATTATATTVTAVATTSQDSSYYQQSPWVGYGQNSYNYHQSWAPYSSYYSSH